MPYLLDELNSAGLIEKLDGNDERFNQIETAAKTVASQLSETPPLLIRAALAGLSPDVPEDDPAISVAAEALQQAWKSVRSVHIDPPIQLYRFILLDACDQNAGKLNVVILWNTVADTLPTVRLGREEPVIRSLLSRWAEKAEKESLLIPSISESKRAPSTKKFEPFNPKLVPSKNIDRDNLKLLVSSASGPHNRHNKKTDSPNPYWSNSGPNWSYEFSDRMGDLLADNLDEISENFSTAQKNLSTQLKDHDQALIDHITGLLANQRSWLQEVTKQSQENQRAEHLRLNTLWWCEAYYSTSYKCSYRELPHYLSAVLMPFDLLTEIEIPFSTSVSYALSETVSKLPKMGFDKEYKLVEILDHLSNQRATFSATWKDRIIPPPIQGKLSLRDIVMAVLLELSTDLSQLISRGGLDEDFSITLPKLAQAIFRQEQAVDLAEDQNE